MAYLRRQLVTTALTANALRPVGGRYATIPAFFAGWLVSELAPQLLVASAADTLVEIAVRRDTGRSVRGDRLALALAAASTAGLGYLIVNANRAASHVETTLRDGLGDDYLDDLEEAPDVEDLKTRFREVARPPSIEMPAQRRRIEVPARLHPRFGIAARPCPTRRSRFGCAGRADPAYWRSP